MLKQCFCFYFPISNNLYSIRQCSMTYLDLTICIYSLLSYIYLIFWPEVCFKSFTTLVLEWIIKKVTYMSYQLNVVRVMGSKNLIMYFYPSFLKMIMTFNSIYFPIF